MPPPPSPPTPTPPPTSTSTSPKEDISKTQASVCGAIAGGASRLLTSPFDVLKIRFQLQVGPIHTQAQRARLAYHTVWQSLTKVTREEGLIGLWRGNLAATYLWVGYGAVQFPVYEFLKTELPAAVPEMRKFDTFIAGGGAGLAATVATYPFDVIRTQFAAQGLPRAHKTMWSFVQATVKGSQGVRGLFAGLMPTAVQIIPRMGLSFALYEKLEAMNHKNEEPKEEAHDENEHEIFLAEAYRWCLSALYGGLSGGIARVVVHPLDTLKRRMQAQVFVSTHTEVYGEQSTRTFPNSWACLQHIVKEEGFLALYKGLSPTLLKSVLSTAIIFSVYEGLKARLLLAAPSSARTIGT